MYEAMGSVDGEIVIRYPEYSSQSVWQWPLLFQSRQ